MTKKKRTYEERRIFVLNNPQAPRLCPELAAEIGLVESILLLQIEFWISVSTTEEHDGERWTFQSIRDIQDMFPFLGTSTINRAIHRLQGLPADKKDPRPVLPRLIKVGNFNRMKYDQTRWFAIDLEGVAHLKSIQIGQPGPCQNGTGSTQNRAGSDRNGTRSDRNGTTIPETTTEITPEITGKRSVESFEGFGGSSPVESQKEPHPEETAGNLEKLVDATGAKAIASYMADLSKVDLHDPEHIRSNVSNALHRFQESRLPERDFIELMHEARGVTLRHSWNIRKQASGDADLKNRAPYFFAVFKTLLRERVAAVNT